MGPNILPEYKNQVCMPVEGPTQVFDKQRCIEEITKFPASLVRELKHLSEFDNSNEPRLQWKIEILNIMDQYHLRELLMLLEKKSELDGRY